MENGHNDTRRPENHAEDRCLGNYWTQAHGGLLFSFLFFSLCLCVDTFRDVYVLCSLPKCGVLVVFRFATANPDPASGNPTYMDQGASPAPVSHPHAYGIYPAMWVYNIFSVSQFCACKEFLVTPAVWSLLCRKLVWVASIYFLWQGWLYVGCRWRLWPRWHHGRSEACRRASPAACREPVEWPAVVTFDRLTRNKTKWALPSNLPYSHWHGLIPLVSLIFFQIAIMWNVHNGCDFFFFFCFPAWKHACQWLLIVFICVISVCKRKYNAKPLMLQCYEKEVMVTHIVHAFSIDFKLIFFKICYCMKLF